MKEKWKEIAYCILSGIIAIVLICIVWKIWNYDLNVPFNYSGDVIGILETIQTFVHGESLWNVSGMGAPFGSNRMHLLFDGSLHYMFLWVLAKLTGSVGYTINIYYILTFAFSAMCTYYMLRKLNVSRLSSMVGGIIYAFIPGHIMRGEAHIFVGSCYLLPLAILGIIYFIRGDFCKKEFGRRKLKGLEVIKSIDKKMLFSILSFIGVTCLSLYYGVFIVIILSFAVLYVAIIQKQWRHVVYYLTTCISMVLSMVLIFLPQYISLWTDPEYVPISDGSRVMMDTEVYGLKLAQLILPITNHRISKFAEIREIYDTGFPLVNENGLATLGLIMSIGFLIGIFTVFFNKGKETLVVLCGKINLFIFSVAVVGGIGSIIGMITYSIRCFNRFSYFIGGFAIIVSMLLFDEIWNRLKRLSFKQKNLLKIFISVALIFMAVFDQTSADSAYAKEDALKHASVYYNDAQFVSNIENYEGENAKVLVLPISFGMSGAVGLTSAGQRNSYDTYFMYLHTQTSDWSVAALPGEKSDQWLESVSYNKEENILKIASAMGFSGVALFYEGYPEDELEKVLIKLESCLGKALFENENETWCYFSMKEFNEELKSDYTEEEWNEIKEVSKDIKKITISGQKLYYTLNDEDGRLLKNSTQYGPYISLTPGEYQVVVRGNNLEKLEFECVSNEQAFEIKNIKKSDDMVEYEIKVEQAVSGVEFKTYNMTSSTAEIDEIDCFIVLEEDVSELIYERFLESYESQ